MFVTNDIHQKLYFNGNVKYKTLTRARKATQSLTSQYIDEFIRAMADSSDKKIVHSLSLSIFPRMSNIKFPIFKGKNLINSWLIKSLFPSENYCLFLHGGTSTVSNYQELYKQLSNHHINTLAVEYPGYGDNRNIETSYNALCETAENAFKYLTDTMNVPADKITILGYCLGGQLATNLSKKVNCKSLLLVSPVTNFGEINKAYVESKNLGKRFHNRLKKFIVNSKIFKLFTSNKLSLYDDLEKVNCPVYLFSSKKDPVTDAKWINKLEERLPDKENITYIKTFEDGHKFTDSKALFIARIISEHIFHSRLNYRI